MMFSHLAPQNTNNLYHAVVRFIINHVSACEHIPDHIKDERRTTNYCVKYTKTGGLIYGEDGKSIIYCCLVTIADWRPHALSALERRYYLASYKNYLWLSHHTQHTLLFHRQDKTYRSIWTHRLDETMNKLPACFNSIIFLILLSFIVHRIFTYIDTELNWTDY